MASARAASVFHTSWRWIRPELGVGILQVSIIDTRLLQRTRFLRYRIATGTLALGTVIRRVPDVSSLNSAAPPRRRHPFRSDHGRNGQTGAPDEERHPRSTRYLPRSVLNKTWPSTAAQIGASLGIPSLGSQDGVPVACLKTSIAVAHPGGAVLAFNTPVGWLLDRGPGGLLYGGLPWWDRVWSDFVLRPRQRAGRRARPARTRSGPSGCPHHSGAWVCRDVGGAASLASYLDGLKPDEADVQLLRSERGWLLPFMTSSQRDQTQPNGLPIPLGRPSQCRRLVEQESYTASALITAPRSVPHLTFPADFYARLRSRPSDCKGILKYFRQQCHAFAQLCSHTDVWPYRCLYDLFSRALPCGLANDRLHQNAGSPAVSNP